MLKPKKSSKKVKLREDGNNYVTKGKVNSKGELTDVKVRRTVKGLVTGAHSVKKAEKMSKMKKGGMSCSCGGKGCMKCGGKKYEDGGKKKVNGMYDFGNTYTGPDSTSPGVIKAKKVAATRDSVLNTYKKKVEQSPTKNNNGWVGKTVKSLTPSKTPVKKAVVKTVAKKKVAPKK